MKKENLINLLNSKDAIERIAVDPNFFETNFHNSTDKKHTLSLMKKDSGFFKDVIESLVNLRKNCNFFYPEEDAKIVDSLNRDGVAVIRNFLSPDMLKATLDFQNWYLELLGDEANIGGKVNFYRNSTGQTFAKNNRFDIEHGELRCQSKSLGFHPPGVEEIISNDRITSIARGWFKNHDAEIWRSTLSYLSPSKNVHIPWHFDDFQDTIKVFVFLEDVTSDNGPMTYAKGSHLLDKEYIRTMKHNFFCHGKTVLDLDKACNGWVKDNFVEETCLDKVIIGDASYENEILVGKKGDIAFADVSGLHSGNLVLSGNRKVLVLSFPTQFSPLNKFINFLAK